MKYNPSKIEKKWQKEWLKKKLYFTRDKVKGKKNFYHLMMLPYTSGDLHMGHWYNYGPGDVFARFKRMQGFNVLSPIGFDAFGLPAENAAIKKNLDPKVWTYGNIKSMKKQLGSIGASFDWSREVITAEPDYYKWTQWIFLKLYEAGLAKREKVLANWCPHCKTILANEQVQDGRCERCDNPVEQRSLDQWVFKIADYARKLLDGLDKIDWPETTKILQKNWIGRSDGALIKFKVENSTDYIDVFTTRPDTVFGATFMVLAPEHELVKKISKDAQLGQVNNYLEKTKKKTELERLAEVKEKTGVFTGAYAFNPATKEKIPIWISDFVLPHYGTGAIMAVPANDQRDFEFAKKFALPIKYTVIPERVDGRNPHILGKEIVFRKIILGIVRNPKTGKYLCLNWKKQPWTTFVIGGIEGNEGPVEAAKREILEETGYKNIKLIKVLGGPVQSKFFAPHKDVNRIAHTWSVLFELENEEREEISAQEAEIHNIVWLSPSEITPERMTHAELDIVMDRINNGEKAFTEDGILRESGKFDGMDSERAKWDITGHLGGKKEIKYRLHDWIISRQRYWGAPIPMIRCQKCGWQPVPEKDLPVKLPKIKDYKPPGTGESPLAKAKDWVNVKCPKCFGPARRETDTMDTFVDSAWYFLRYADPKNKKEFASKEKLKAWLPVDMYIGGQEHATKHLLYARFITKVLRDSGYLNFDEPFKTLRHQGLILADRKKMSKSRGNAADPDEMVRMHGSDAVRMHLCFMGPYEQGGPWDPKAIIGVYRFLNRVWNFIGKKPGSEKSDKVFSKTIKKIGEDIENLRFNTAVSELMKLLNEIEDLDLTKSQKETFLKLLAPFAPHLTEELWRQLGNKKSIHLEKWPKYDPEIIEEETIDLVIQINGRTRDIIKAPRGLAEDEAKELVLKSEKIKKHLAGKEPLKFIYIQNKLINIVLN